MKRTVVTALLITFWMAGIVQVIRAQQPTAAALAEMHAHDKGPAKVDVSSYPADIQSDYKLFLDKCGKCHSPARAINSDLVLEDEWEQDVQQMMSKAKTLISPDDAKRITDFLVYDSQVRKKDMYNQKLMLKNVG
jgi:hypothetical protein